MRGDRRHRARGSGAHHSLRPARAGGRDCIVALVALGVDRPGPEVHDHLAPNVAAPDELAVRPTPPPGAPDIPFRHRFDVRPAIGTPLFTAGPDAETGGWIRTRDGDPIDDLLLVALTDSWPPAVFTRLEARVGVPTMKLTVHLRGAPCARVRVVPRAVPHPGGGRGLPGGDG